MNSNALECTTRRNAPCYRQAFQTPMERHGMPRFEYCADTATVTVIKLIQEQCVNFRSNCFDMFLNLDL